MRNILTTLGAAALLVAGLTTPASAAPLPTGLLCGMATSDALAPGNQQGVLVGGPITLGDDSNPAVVYSGSITCSFQLGIFNSQHSAPDTCNGTGATSGVVATYIPTSCSFGTAPGGWPDEGYVCTQLDIIGFPTFYYADSGLPGVPGSWSTSAASSCTRVAWADSSGAKQLVDDFVCPVLTPFFPPHGDVGIFYDCPPYSSPTPLTSVTYFWLQQAHV